VLETTLGDADVDLAGFDEGGSAPSLPGF